MQNTFEAGKRYLTKTYLQVLTEIQVKELAKDGKYMRISIRRSDNTIYEYWVESYEYSIIEQLHDNSAVDFAEATKEPEFKVGDKIFVKHKGWDNAGMGKIEVIENDIAHIKFAKGYCPLKLSHLRHPTPTDLIAANQTPIATTKSWTLAELEAMSKMMKSESDYLIIKKSDLK